MVFNRGGKLNLILLALIGLIIYKLTSFPEHLQNIEPQQFEVHALSDDESYIRDLKLMKPKVFIDRRLGMCEDIEVGSNEMVYCVN